MSPSLADLQIDAGWIIPVRPATALRAHSVLVAGGRIVGEAPVRGVVDIEDLDSLGPARCPAP